MQGTIITTKNSNIMVTVEHKDGCDVVHALSGNRVIAQHQKNTTVLPGVDPRSCQIWRLYEQAHYGNLVVRSGLGLCGCYSYNPDAHRSTYHTESVTEHASGCITIAQGLVNNYPQLLPPQYWDRLIFLLRYHDIGENSYQDRPDDGTQNALEKEAVELVEFASTMLNFPDEFAEVAIKDFAQFQQAKTIYDENDPICFQIGQLARIIDKFEAVLSGVFYEQTGAVGNLYYKKFHYGPLTEQDEYYVGEADPRLVDAWAAHLIHHYYSLRGFPYLLDILRAAVIAVRGEWFPWFDKFCTKHDIPESATTYPQD